MDLVQFSLCMLRRLPPDHSDPALAGKLQFKYTTLFRCEGPPRGAPGRSDAILQERCGQGADRGAGWEPGPGGDGISLGRITA